MEIYCVRCKVKTVAKSPKKVVMKNGMNAVQGICSLCGSKVSVITGKSDKAVTRNSSREVHEKIASSLSNYLLHPDPIARAWLTGFHTASELAKYEEAPRLSKVIDEAELYSRNQRK